MKTFLIILMVLIALRILFKIFRKPILAWLGKKAMQRFQKSFEKRAGFNNPYSATNKSENAYQTPDKSFKKARSKEKKKVGEYVDFEEID
ncbi:DUF4834 family protein [Nonlabens sp. SY33080]|uniref:DUF4834 family protein n=1 Tax=Nonlabens sp. SY33080 TaxID=2719911 RepID=UPI000CF3E841|nr:DUF4834 family protein [Nonlabens sp. SY33080]PQJ18350.1 hypothetical protein BST93_07585 [Nonlabens tegetincola]